MTQMQQNLINKLDQHKTLQLIKVYKQSYVVDFLMKMKSGPKVIKKDFDLDYDHEDANNPAKKIPTHNLLCLNSHICGDYDNLASFFLIANRLQTFIFLSDDYSRRTLMDILPRLTISHFVRAWLESNASRARASEQELLK